jgi:hypothetical protein
LSWEWKPFPADQRGASLELGNERLAGGSLPPGRYISANGQMVVFNYYGGTTNTVAGGIVGLAVDTLAKNAQAKSVAAVVDAVTFDLRQPTQAFITRQLTPLLANQPAAGDSRLTITPFAYFVQEEPGRFRIRALLRATLIGTGGKQLWTNDYLCPAAELRPLDGDESWFAQDRYGAAFASTIEHIAPVLAKDVLGQLMPGRIVTIAAGRGWDTRSEGPVTILEESDDWLVTRTAQNGKKIAATVELIDRHSAEIKPFDPKKR